MHHACRIAVLVLIAASLAACAAKPGPADVAAAFWNAIEAGNTRAVKRHVTAADAALLENLDDVLPISNAELSRIVIDGEKASVDTTVTVDGDKPLDFPLKTHLVLEGDDWKVDYRRTIDAVASAGKLAAMLSKVHEFGDALQEGIERSVDELEQALPKIEQELSRFEQQMKQRMPELRERLEEFTRELEEAIKRPPPADPSEPGATVEI